MQTALQMTEYAQGSHQAFEYIFARQPIYDLNCCIFGYELLYRGSDENRAVYRCANQATLEVMNCFLVEAGVIKSVGKGKAFINMTEEILLSDEVLLLSPDTVVLELLEDIVIDANLLDRIRYLRLLGYQFALDDFTSLRGKKDLVECADYVKIDIRAISREKVGGLIEYFKRRNCRVLIEKVESWEEMEFCRSMEVDYVQGYFLSRPEMMRGEPLPQDSLIFLEVVQELYDENTCMKRLAELISRDPYLCVKMLRYFKSSFVGEKREVGSIQQMTIMLGLTKIRQLIAMLAMRKTMEPSYAIMSIVMARAKFCELGAALLKLNVKPADAFLTGMFSALEMLFKCPMREILLEISLKEEISAALLYRSGELGKLLMIMERLEKNKLNGVKGMSKVALEQCFHEALVWTTLEMAHLYEQGAE